MQTGPTLPELEFSYLYTSLKTHVGGVLLVLWKPIINLQNDNKLAAAAAGTTQLMDFAGADSTDSDTALARWLS